MSNNSPTQPNANLTKNDLHDIYAFTMTIKQDPYPATKVEEKVVVKNEKPLGEVVQYFVAEHYPVLHKSETCTLVIRYLGVDSKTKQ